MHLSNRRIWAHPILASSSKTFVVLSPCRLVSWPNDHTFEVENVYSLVRHFDLQVGAGQVNLYLGPEEVR